MVDNVIQADRQRTLIRKINAAIDALNADITDLSTNYLNKTTSKAQTVTAATTFSDDVTVDGGAVDITNGAIGDVPLKVTGMTGTTTDLLQVYDDATKAVYVNNAGKFFGQHAKFTAPDTSKVGLKVNNPTSTTVDVFAATINNVAKLQVGSNGETTIADLRVVAGVAPSSASATGTTNQIIITSSYIYFCHATDTWVRAALATW